jgi:hypothetical protein
MFLKWIQPYTLFPGMRPLWLPNPHIQKLFYKLIDHFKIQQQNALLCHFQLNIKESVEFVCINILGKCDLDRKNRYKY